MTATIDRFWIAQGIEAEELNAIKGRKFIYGGLFSMAIIATTLVGGIAANLSGVIA